VAGFREKRPIPCDRSKRARLSEVAVKDLQSGEVAQAVHKPNLSQK
jgi:hypothetical protein